MREIGQVTQTPLGVKQILIDQLIGLELLDESLFADEASLEKGDLGIYVVIGDGAKDYVVVMLKPESEAVGEHKVNPFGVCLGKKLQLKIRRDCIDVKLVGVDVSDTEFAFEVAFDPTLSLMLGRC